ncbi:type II toxin-antitoxin system HipA family toxin [Sulfuriferula thiophila]|uniref:type II toxin-antitoxin system HipA family toxin n=1 Tax=Sulfuriferula thiophila TaxID=1781211 RepID=UPI000F6086F2|nr:type II toxin-antitoxin system HipA family toxin [Sulfuriferula thiophila]
MDEIKVVEVKIWDQSVGAVAPLRGKPGFYEFQYLPTFVKSGLELSPLLMQLSTKKRFSFPSLSTETFHGLPGMLADALPDKFGNALIDEYLTRTGTKATDITTLQRMVYVGRRAIGALEFAPAADDIRSPGVAVPLEMSSLVEDARRALRGEFSAIAQDILDVGSSAGGARAKAVIGWNPDTGAVVSGQFEVPDGYEHWLLKFDVGLDGVLSYATGFGRIEYAHYLMATEAGVHMSECRLLEENGRAHFMTKRFDRRGNQKLHTQSLCGLAHLDFNIPATYSYEQYLRTVLEMNLGAQALEQAWIRCAFNIAAVNCDDHTKNLAFLLDPESGWSLAPAYDVCFSHNPAAGKWTRQHQMLVGGKAWGITDIDLIALAQKFDVRQPQVLLQRITDAVARWPEFARIAGVTPEATARILSYHPDWLSPRATRG